MSPTAQKAATFIVTWVTRHAKEMADHPHTVRIIVHEGKAFKISYFVNNTKDNIQIEATNSISLTLLQPCDEWIDIIANIHEQIEGITQ